MARRSWAIDAFVGAVFKRRGGDSLGMGRGFNSAPILTGFHGQKASNFCLDRTTIGPRSCVNRDPRALSIIVGLGRVDSAAEGVRSRLDRGSIAARSRLDREVLPQHLCTVRCESREPSDVDQVSRPISIDFDQLAAAVGWRSIARWSVHRSMKIGSSL